jgi:TolB-like protein/Flp pilus assembly protein TadD
LSFFKELKRRNVVRVAIAYAVAAWVFLQIADLVLENIVAPGWVMQVMMLVILLGFIASVIIAWAYELTPDGVKRQSEIDLDHSITAITGHKLDRIIIGFLALAVAYFAYDKSTTAMSPTIEPASLVAEQAAGVPDLSAEPSIAVLPFVNMSPDADQEFFSDGISEELLNLLVKVEGMKVASRTSSFNYKGSTLSLADIASELQVDHVLEGSVRKSDNRVRITAQLIDAGSDRHLWSDTYDRELTDIFGIQDEIANAIVAALSAELGILQDTPVISVATATEDLDAYELYLKARGLFLARQQLEESITLYERAVELDPEFARAWEGLAAVYSVVESWGILGRDWDSLAMQAAERALDLNPGLSTPWAVMGQIATNNGDYITGMANTDRAIELDPANATNYLWRGINYSDLGFQAESIVDYKHCLEIDPAYANCKRHLALAYMVVNENELALSLIEQVAKFGFSVLDFQSQYLQRLISLENRLAATLILLSHFDYDLTFPATVVLDAMEFPERDHSRGLQELLKWIEKSGSAPELFSVMFVSFNAYHLVGPAVTQTRWVWLRENTGFRASEYFAPLMNENGAASYWREHGFPPNCRRLDGEGFECD